MPSALCLLAASESEPQTQSGGRKTKPKKTQESKNASLQTRAIQPTISEAASLGANLNHESEDRPVKWGVRWGERMEQLSQSQVHSCHLPVGARPQASRRGRWNG